MKHLRRLWCRIFHSQPMWPVHGRYACRICQEVFKVGWEVPVAQPAVAPGAISVAISCDASGFMRDVAMAQDLTDRYYQ